MAREPEPPIASAPQSRGMGMVSAGAVGPATPGSHRSGAGGSQLLGAGSGCERLVHDSAGAETQLSASSTLGRQFHSNARHLPPDLSPVAHDRLRCRHAGCADSMAPHFIDLGIAVFGYPLADQREKAPPV